MSAGPLPAPRGRVGDAARAGLRAALLVLAIFALSRAILRGLPGDPVETLIAQSGTAIPEAEIRREFRLDRAFWPALAEDARAALHGDLGVSLLNREPVAPLVLRRCARTALLTACALAAALALSVALGLLAARRAGSAWDSFCSVYGAAAAALPSVWLGPILLALLGPIRERLRAAGLPGTGIGLPALTLAIGLSGIWARLIRERVAETLRYGAADGARARGMHETRVLLKYGLAPAAGALWAYLGSQVGALLGGAFVTEVVFDWKGLGSLLVESTLARDYPVVEASVFACAVFCVLGNRLGRGLQRAMDPRQRAAPGGARA